MLNGVEWLPGRILERPSCVLWNGALRVAHLDLAQQVTVTSIDVSTMPISSASKSLGITTPLAPAIAVLGSELVIAVADPEQPIRFLLSSDGVTYTPGAPTSFTAIAAPALAASQQLWLAWMDADRVMHVANGYPAAALSDTVTTVTLARPPALAAYDDLVGTPQIALAWRDAGGVVAMTVFTDTSFDPALPARAIVPEANVDHLALAFAPGHAGTAARVVVAFEREEPPRTRARDHRMYARQVSADLAEVGGVETMGSPGLGPGLARGPGRVWAAWRDMADHADHLTIAPYDVVFDLPDNLRALLGKECDPNLCPPDPRLVCEATDVVDWRYDPAWIRNARKGDLVVTPASGSGLIGGFLKELQFEQQYDHMGIMIEDHRVVRHATMAHDRLKAFYVGSLLGEPAPTDGFRPDALQYGWPGTITQSVHNAFMPWEGFNDNLNPEWTDPTAPDPGPPPLASASDEAKDQHRKAVARFRGFVDPEQKEDSHPVGYAFPNLTWPPQYRPDGTVIEAVVVKPPPEVEAFDSLVRPTLHRVAEAAKTIRGHYRFFSYTQGTIATAAIFNGPPKGHARWNGLPPGADWAAGSAAVVCSTFIWAAVRKASSLRLPQLALEGASEPSVEEQWRKQLHVIHDGLYRYHSDERRKAAQALYDNVSADVRAQVWAKLMKLKSDFGWIVTVVQVGLTSILALLAMPIAALASFLGIQIENAKVLVTGLTDMPDDVGNQICNTFASDRPDEKDEALWKQTGEGVSVAPHDVIYLWDAPTVQTPRYRQGLWGAHERLILPEPRWERRRIHEFGRSHGLAVARGTVRYRRTGDPIIGALVRIGCESTLSGEGGQYSMEVSAGQREIIGGAYWPQAKWWLEDTVLARLEPGDNPDHDLTLDDPPEWRRVLQIRLKTDLVHQVLIGKDDWLHDSGLFEHRFVRHPEGWGAPPDGAPSLTWNDLWDDKFAYLTNYAGDERARLRIRATMDATSLAIKVDLRAELLEDEDAEVEASANHTTTVPMDGQTTVKFSLKSGETPPDRAWLEVKLLNFREMA